MKRNYVLISISLLISLFIYLFYRSEKTVITSIFISIFSLKKFATFREIIKTLIPLNKFIVYCLPEGLWVFSTTLTSKFLFVKIGKKKIQLLLMPLVFAIALEFFQLLHFTNGRFDFYDIISSILFWGIANYFINYKNTSQNILNPINSRGYVCIASYVIILLAHVWK